MGKNGCDNYQMSPDGVKVISCKIDSGCTLPDITPKCTKYYPKFEESTKAD